MNLSSSRTLHGEVNLCAILGINIAEEVHVNKFCHSMKNAKECFGLYQKGGIFATHISNKQPKGLYLPHERQTRKNLFIQTTTFYRWSEVGRNILTRWSSSFSSAGKILYLLCLIWVAIWKDTEVWFCNASRQSCLWVAQCHKTILICKWSFLLTRFHSHPFINLVTHFLSKVRFCWTEVKLLCISVHP